MKNLAKIGSLVLLVSLVSSCTINKPEEKSRTITVSGEASSKIRPDIEVIEFVVSTAGWSAKQIVQDNDLITGRFVNAVKEVGVSEEDIFQSECVLTNPNSYEARRTVVVTARNLSLVPAIIDCKTGLIRLRSTSLEAADTQSQIRSVRAKAVQNASDAAGLIAGASGCRLGNVVSIAGDEIKTEKTSDNCINLTAKVVISYDLE